MTFHILFQLPDQLLCDEAWFFSLIGTLYKGVFHLFSFRIYEYSETNPFPVLFSGCWLNLGKLIVHCQPATPVHCDIRIASKTVLWDSLICQKQKHRLSKDPARTP